MRSLLSVFSHMAFAPFRVVLDYFNNRAAKAITDTISAPMETTNENIHIRLSLGIFISLTSLHFVLVDLSLRFPYNGYTVYQTESKGKEVFMV